MCSFHKFLVYSRQTWIQPLVSMWEWEQERLIKEDGLGTKMRKKGRYLTRDKGKGQETKDKEKGR